MNKIAITTGDPNGIGAEITIKALNKLKIDSDKVVIISNKEVLDYYGKLDIPYEIIECTYQAKDIIPGAITHDSKKSNAPCRTFLQRTNRSFAKLSCKRQSAGGNAFYCR